jgi:hypothetical protein
VTDRAAPSPEEKAAAVEADLALLRALRSSIDLHEDALASDYAARLAAYQRLRALGVKQEPIAEAAGVGPSAVGFALHDARRKERLAAMTAEERAAERAKARKGKGKKRNGRARAA